jgi:CubicO group peptidase (beta-lactamase class C family)
VAVASKVEIRGHVSPEFEGVRAEFERNFVERGELGASLFVTLRGETVIDLSAGLMDRTSGRPWERDTRAVVWSATKGLVAIGFLLLTDRGLVDPDLPVSHYWPGFAREGKEGITVRQLLNHRGGLIHLPNSLKVEDLARPEEVREILERTKPAWKPGSNQGYHAITWGSFAGELFRQITGVSVGQFLAAEVFGPLGADTAIGVAVDDPIHAKIADVIPFERDDLFLRVIPEALFGHTCETRTFRRLIGRLKSETSRAFRSGPSLGSRRLHAVNDPAIQAIEMPWCGAVTSAEGLARCYTPLALGGTWEGVTLCRPETIEPVTKIQSWSERDLVLQKPIGWSQGFTKDEAHIISPRDEAFGHTGMGGSVGFADPSTGMAFGYVMNRMDWRIRSPRCIALCRAVYRALGII